MRIDAEPDVFAARQLARTVAQAAGLDGQDQVRFATAVSEVGRDALAVGGAEVGFALRPEGVLLAMLSADGAFPAAGSGVAAAGRLVDVSLDSLDDPVAPPAPPAGRRRGRRGRVVTLAKALPAGAAVDGARYVGLRRMLAAVAPISPADELRLQNTELIGALEQLQDKQDQLLRLNAELEETNRGVLALYNQLSGELEETNRGVLALYAELDERNIALTRANEAKTRFLRSLSHELRTPVNSVLGLARLLLDPAADPLTDPQRRQVEFVLASSGDLLALVDDLLDLAKAESGGLGATIEEVDVTTLLAHLDGTMRPLATRADVRLVIEEAAGVGTLRTDETLLGRVLRNLVGNALKFTERGEVRLSAHADGDPTDRGGPGEAVVFTVRDTGIGIAPTDAELVFEDFYQARSHLHGRVRGAGLGLPYARRVCELLGGRLELASELGRGSTFTVTIPRARGRAPGQAGDAPQARPSAPAEGPTGSGDGAKIETALVVDDDPAFRSVMRSLLSGRVDRMIEAADGRAALARLRDEPPGVVFLDLILPGLDGASVLSAMNDDPALRDVPVVIVTWTDIELRCGRTAVRPAAAVISKSSLSEGAIDAALARVSGCAR
jgi:signal transduction histidine kinase